MNEYLNYWIDKYSGGYRSTTSHAVHQDENMVSICGMDFKKYGLEIGGGYQAIDEVLPDCKKCLKKLGKIKGLDF